MVDGAKRVVLDTKEITIKDVVAVSSGAKLAYELLAHPLSTGLSVSIPEEFSKQGSVWEIRVDFETSPNASGIQWLPPAQTAGKVHPYMFTQHQAIHCRGTLPSADTPAQKITYSAEIVAPAPLTALMSAEFVKKQSTTVDGKETVSFFFEQKIPVPTYLIALVIGAIESREVGPRTRVWAEPDVVDKAAWEFAETEQMLATAESLLGPYVWAGRYDLLVLPPSFPYGGMENPMLTFVTPTLLAGDRSLVAVIVHEIVHSWFGNLVTNKTWAHFWLNEGFTRFAEMKIIGRMYGEPVRQASHIGGLKSLKDSVDLYGHEHPFTALVPKLGDADPDDAFSSVPYEKGAAILYYLESILGGPEAFEPFLRAYIDAFKYKSVDTDEWKAFLYAHFADKKAVLDSVDWDAWLYAPGMPPVSNKHDSSLLDVAHALAQQWMESADGSGFTADAYNALTSFQRIAFLDYLNLQGAKLAVPVLQAMDALYALTQCGNSEIKYKWQQLCLRSEWDFIFPHAVDFITSQGRMKYVRPIYRALHKCAAAGDLATRTFLENRSIYNNIAATMLAKDLGLN